MTPTLPLSLTAEQQELRDSFRSFLAEHAPLSAVRKRFEQTGQAGPALWNKLMELGVLSYFSESIASGGGTLRDLGLLAAEAGYAVLPENLIDAALVAHLIAESTDEDRKLLQSQFGPSILQDISSGTLRTAISAPSAEFVEIAVSKTKSQVLSGSARYVAGVGNPSLLLVVHTEADSVFACDLRSVKHAGTPEDLLDRAQNRFHLTLKDAPCVKLSTANAKSVGFMQQSLLAAELSGVARKALDLAVEYVKTREQFDVPVGGFQAVQHAAADMMVRVEALAALSDFACWACDSSRDQLELAAPSAALYGYEEAPKVVEKAIQLHGGIGFTWEHDLHLLLRRARTIAGLIAPRADTYTDLIAAAGKS